MRGQHGAHRERRLGVLGVHDGLRHRALHGLGQGGELRLEQVLDEYPVLRHAAFPQDARAVREQLPGGRDPEGVHRILLLGDQGRGHRVEIPGRPGFQERRPARRPGVEGIHQDVASGVVEGPRVAPHLVVEDAALAPLPDLGDQVRDQDGLARTRGARDDGVLGLGAFGPGDARDAGSGLARGRKEFLRQAGGEGPDASFERLSRGHFRAPHPVRPRHAPAQEPEEEREECDAAQAEPEAQPSLGINGIEHAPPDPFDPRIACDELDPLDRPLIRAPLVHLARIGGIPDGEFGLGQRAQAHDAPLVRARRREDADRGRQDDSQDESKNSPARELAPHPGVVEQGLAAPQGGVSDGHSVLLFHAVCMVAPRASRPRDAPEVLRPGEDVRARGGKSTAVMVMPVIFLGESLGGFPLVGRRRVRPTEPRQRCRTACEPGLDAASRLTDRGGLGMGFDRIHVYEYNTKICGFQAGNECNVDGFTTGTRRRALRVMPLPPEPDTGGREHPSTACIHSLRGCRKNVRSRTRRSSRLPRYDDSLKSGDSLPKGRVFPVPS